MKTILALTMFLIPAAAVPETVTVQLSDEQVAECREGGGCVIVTRRLMQMLIEQSRCGGRT